MFNAAEFLTSLYEPPSAHPVEQTQLPPITPTDLPADWNFLWDERAAIMEYDGGLPRERAEALALTEIVQRMRQGEGPTDGPA